MEKPAEPQYEIHDLIKRRWSPRAFDPRPVEQEKIQRMLEAARWAPSSSNEQPWAYLVATKEIPDEFARMVACLVPGNQAWAKDAPLLMISIARMYFQKNNQPNRVALHDVGAASAYLTMQALDMGLFVHQMGGIEIEKIRTEYQLPPRHEPVAALAIGYSGDCAKLAEPYKSREIGP
ncbi:MAG TPA: nitroreductase family protein, partial [Tepidisphaeraceae bacterium]|nr:nitroreductase family protein [Tepidisphaeraceae bacterium]